MIFCYQLLENAADKFISSAIRLKKTSKKKTHPFNFKYMKFSSTKSSILWLTRLLLF